MKVSPVKYLQASLTVTFPHRTFLIATGRFIRPIRRNRQTPLLIFALVAAVYFAPSWIVAGPVGLVPFQNPAGPDARTPAALTVALKQAGRYEIVEQSRLDAIIEEIKKAQTGLVDEQTAAQIGHLVGAQYLVVGESREENGTLEAAYRIVQVETGIVIGADRAKGPTEEAIKQLQSGLMRQLDLYMNLDNPESPYTILLKLPARDSVYKVGQTLSLKFKVIAHRPDAPRRVYIQLYSINARGAMTLIYPNRFSGFDAIEVDREYVFPSEKDDFEWELVPPVGNESIQAIVTTEPFDVFHTFSKAKEAFPEIQKNGHDPLTTRGIQTQLKKEKLKDWKAQRVTYELAE